MNQNHPSNDFSPQIQQELLELVGAICNENLDDTQAQRLEQILADNRAAQLLYGQYMQIHSELFWHQDAITCLTGADSGSVETNHVEPRFRSSRAAIGPWFWPLALAAMLFLGTTIGIFVQGWLNPLADFRETLVRGIPEKANSPAMTDQVARVTGSLNCRWESELGRIPIGFGSELHAGQQLDLVEGIAEITFDNGVRVILQAPSRLDLATGESSVLHRGRITASVPAGAEGFQVNTENLTLIDRGTEFGVLADAHGNTEVHVFDGLVEGHYRDDKDGEMRKIKWRTNDMVRFNGANKQVEELKKTEGEFVRSLAPALGPFNGLLTDEEFDYPTGPLGGQNGGFGWGGPWHDMSVEDGLPKSNAVDAGSLRFGVLSSSGNHAVLQGQFNRIRRVLSTSFGGVFDTAGLIENQDGQRLIGREGTSLYISFSQRVSDLDQVFYGFELNRGDGNRNRVVCLGHGAAKGWVDGPIRSPNKEAGVTGWAVTSEYNGDPQNGLKEFGEMGEETTEVVFVVVKISFGADNNDTIEVFKNPASLWDELRCEPQVVGKGNFAFDRIGLANFEGNKTFQIDHIRVGTNFAAVTRPRWSSDPVAANGTSN